MLNIKLVLNTFHSISKMLNLKDNVFIVIVKLTWLIEETLNWLVLVLTVFHSILCVCWVGV